MPAWNMRLDLTLCAYAVAAVLDCTPMVYAQEAQSALSTVQAYGEHVLELAPQKVRLLLVAQARGSDAKEAVAMMAKHKQHIRDELMALNADRESIQIAPAEIRSQLVGLPKQYQGLSPRVLTSFLGGSVPVNIEELPVEVIASCIVEADWTLPTTDADLLLQLPNKIREQVTNRDLMGEENQLPLSPEQEARVEKFKETIDEHLGYYDEDDETTSRLQIIYVASVSSDAKAQALKAAFEQARQECSALAQASGTKLDRMINLSGTNNDSRNDYLVAETASGGAGALLSRQARAARRNEIIAARPDLLTARFQVRATFAVGASVVGP